MGDNLIYLPQVDRNHIVMPHNYVIAPGNVKQKWLRWLMQKALNFMFKKEFVKHDSYVEQWASVKTVELDLEKLDEQIVMQRRIIEDIYRKRIDTLIVGADVMRKIMRNSLNPYDMNQIHFEMNMESKFAMYSGKDEFWNPKYERVRYQGLHIIVVPWFKGFLPLQTKERY